MMGRVRQEIFVTHAAIPVVVPDGGETNGLQAVGPVHAYGIQVVACASLFMESPNGALGKVTGGLLPEPVIKPLLPTGNHFSGVQRGRGPDFWR